MEKRYRSALHRRMEAMLMPGIGSAIRVDIPGRKE